MTVLNLADAIYVGDEPVDAVILDGVAVWLPPPPDPVVVVPYFTGGTVVESGGYRTHTFTSSGTLVCVVPGTVEALVVGGGGSGGTSAEGGGGGGGGAVASNSALDIEGDQTVTVGAGGSSSNGGDSSLGSLLTALGGGRGGGTLVGQNGAGGGGGRGADTGGNVSAGVGSPGQNGGTGFLTATALNRAGGGGGGMTGAGANASSLHGGAGGAGVSSSITGTAVTRGGGGGGGTRASSGSGGVIGAGADGGRNGGTGGTNGIAGSANRGGGGGGGGGGGTPGTGGAGGSGVVIVRYPLALDPTAAVALLGPSGSRMVIWDDFTRSDRTLSHDYANTGQRYLNTAEPGAAHIVSQRYVRSPLATYGPDGGSNLKVKLADIPEAIAAKAVFMPGGTTVGDPNIQNFVIGTTYAGFGISSVQFGMWPDRYLLFITERIDDEVVYPTLATDSISLPTDGTTPVFARMTVDLDTSTVTCDFGLVSAPQQIIVSDPRIAEYWNNQFIVQHRHPHVTDGEIKVSLIAAADFA